MDHVLHNECNVHKGETCYPWIGISYTRVRGTEFVGISIMSVGFVPL